MLIFLALLGALGLFLYGTKLLSESLQKLAGDRLRSVLASMTRSRVSGVWAGLWVTALIQSSSATTVLIASFVQAGLISLAQSAAIIMGANVGTSVTAWVIATFAFQVPITSLLLPLIALALPLFLSSHGHRNAWGDLVVGFVLIFLGLDVLQQFIPMLRDAAPGLVSFLTDSCSGGAAATLGFMAAGMLLAMLLQASTASFAVALLLCQLGWISFPMGCAMILGSNLGTCFTPLLASWRAYALARRAASVHILFNLLGVCWASALFSPLCEGLQQLWLSFGWDDPSLPGEGALALAMFHSVFNVLTLLLLLPFSRPLLSLVTRLFPERHEPDDAFRLQYLNKGLIASGELSLLQVKKETIRYAHEVYRMFGLVQQMLHERIGSQRQGELYLAIRDMEQQSDRAEIEIAQFLGQISHHSLSSDGEQLSRALFKMVDELESIADSLYHMAATLRNKGEQRIFFTPAINANVARMMQLTDLALSHMLRVIESDQVSPNALNRAYNNEDEINNFRSQIRNEVLDPMDQTRVQYQQSTCYLDLISECERIGDYVINVLTAQSQA